MAEEMKVTKEEFEKAVEWCANNDECYDCPFDSKPKVCGEYFARYIYDQKNEPAPSANDTSSNDGKNLYTCYDTTDIEKCQEYLSEIKIMLDSIVLADMGNATDLRNVGVMQVLVRLAIEELNKGN